MCGQFVFDCLSKNKKIDQTFKNVDQQPEFLTKRFILFLANVLDCLPGEGRGGEGSSQESRNFGHPLPQSQWHFRRPRRPAPGPGPRARAPGPGPRAPGPRPRAWAPGCGPWTPGLGPPVPGPLRRAIGIVGGDDQNSVIPGLSPPLPAPPWPTFLILV